MTIRLVKNKKVAPEKRKQASFMLNVYWLTKQCLLKAPWEIGLNPSHKFYINARGNQGYFFPVFLRVH